MRNERITCHRVWPWLMWGLGAVTVLYQFLLQSSTSVMIPLLMREFHVGEAGIGFLTSSFFYTYLLLQVPAGMLIDRFGVRVTLMVGMVLAAGASFLFAHAHGLVVASMSRIFMGAVVAPCVAAALYLAANWFSPQRFALLAGLTEMLGLFGGAVGETTLAEAVVHVGWRETLFIIGSAALLLALLIGIFLRNRPSDKQCQRFKLPHCAEHQNMTELLQGFLAIMFRPQIWLVGLFTGLTFAVISAFAGLWAVPILQGLFRVKLEVAAAGSSVIFLGAAVGAPMWGWLSDRLKRRRPVMFYATLINLVITAVFVFVPHLSLAAVFILVSLMGLFSGVYVLAFAIVRETTDSRIRGSAMGFTNMMGILIGAPILQPLIGYLLENYHNGMESSVTKLPTIAYGYALISLLACLLLALLCALFIRETYVENQHD